uniref:Uncharacterized protein n=1 Tax=Arion vulgaris TaxID=1028688 RepID=A0A0B7B402_9EUPU
MVYLAMRQRTYWQRQVATHSRHIGKGRWLQSSDILTKAGDHRQQTYWQRQVATGSGHIIRGRQPQADTTMMYEKA